MNLDKRKKYIMVVDTETCWIDRKKGISGGGTNGLVYDIGYLITDKKGNVYHSNSFIVQEIFFGETQRMKSAYYTNKISQYLKDITKGKRKVASWWEIKAEMAKATKKYNVSAITAFNAKFDWLVTRNTSIYLSKGKITGFLPFIEMWDIQLMSVVIADTKTYQRFCQEHKYLTKTGLPSVKVEVLYRYLNNDITLRESHTGLEDCLVEKDILVKCLKKHKKMKKKLFLKST